MIPSLSVEASVIYSEVYITDYGIERRFYGDVNILMRKTTDNIVQETRLTTYMVANIPMSSAVTTQLSSNKYLLAPSDLSLDEPGPAVPEAPRLPGTLTSPWVEPAIAPVPLYSGSCGDATPSVIHP